MTSLPARMAWPTTLLLVGAALIGTIYLATARIFAVAATRSALEQVALLVRIHDLVHHLQVERGLTVGVLARGSGQPPGEELRAARNRSDREIAALGALASPPDAEPVASSGVRDAVEALAALPGWRQAVDGGQPNALGAFSGYSQLIERLLGVGDRQVRRIDDAQLQSDGGALAAFARAKEAAGRERGILNGVFARGHLDAASVSQLMTLAGMQEAYLLQFETLASGRIVSAYVAGKEDAFRETEHLRNFVLTRPDEALRLKPGIWFAAATAKMDWMKIIEDLMAREIERRAVEGAAKTRSALIWNLVLAALTIAATLVLAVAPFGEALLRRGPESGGQPPG